MFSVENASVWNHVCVVFLDASLINMRLGGIWRNP